MAIVVQKYGGSSVSTVEKIKNIAKTVIDRKKSGNSMVVVVSAMGDTTDELIDLANQVTDNPDKRELDALLSTGEMRSAALLAMAIKASGEDAISYTAYQIGIKTSGQYGKSLIEDINKDRLKKSIDDGKIIIVAGFQGINEEGNITTLGRGGSDTTAVAIAAKLDGVCEIYTDVDGIYSVDPREYKKARKLDEIDYEEMLELSSLGAQVMHPRSIELGQKYNIPIYVGLSNSKIKGTIIKGESNMNMENKPVTGVATSDDDVAVTIKNINGEINLISNLFESIASKKINIDMISQTAPIDDKINISFTIPKLELDECLNILKDHCNVKTQVDVDEDITKFSIVGIGMKTTSGVAAKMFKLFRENNIQVKMITTSEIRVTCAIKHEDKLRTVKIVAKEFNL
ncbi:aspartate kinase [Clostridium tyrobutyricum]|uniref:Aspartokinase n=1 Tax=Clostridium tyrobutyricum DIVETGP TaxID=1408889 RepID=W6N954_CLOTY|nr:aspartate kinase [Clostridium tyrobutyricum]AND85933.1 aspartokinase [Clostridium tyrobutyricum]ANP70441.1 aspartate kinase [Clostridium tyrobutyricum]MBR9647516.1 aspartate kinase [Clostridium tyrobutyricum]MBV4414708.1 aspartate kinase [Clostridium tyrobutyricum]MBV4423129.1 aspartate kinase [Clostridium tyrobutyricum]